MHQRCQARPPVQPCRCVGTHIFRGQAEWASRLQICSSTDCTLNTFHITVPCCCEELVVDHSLRILHITLKCERIIGNFNKTVTMHQISASWCTSRVRLRDSHCPFH